MTSDHACQNPRTDGCHSLAMMVWGQPASRYMAFHCPHGVMIGSDIIEEAESRNHVFEAILRRWREPPSIVVYDFGCALHEYFLSRQPHFFKYTKVLIDRLHWRNHRTCPGALWIGRFPSLSDLNSQCAEQYNSNFILYKATLRRVTLSHYQSLTRVIYRLHNQRKNAINGAWTGFQSDFRIMVSHVLDTLCPVQVLSWTHLLDHALALARRSVSVSVRTPTPFLPRLPLPPDILHHTAHNSVAAHRHLIPAAALRSEPSQRRG